jgi:hypothetical protein
MVKILVLNFFFAFVFAASANSSTFVWASSPDSLLLHARTLFYRSVENESSLPNAIAAFKRLEQYGGKWKATGLTYRGALEALKGKHAFWPHKKLEYVNKGLPLMDRGLAMQPDNIELLFVHASTCYYLPFFFGRGDEAERHFRKIISLLPTMADNYSPELVENAISFIRENIGLSQEERLALDAVSPSLGMR